MLPVPLEVVEDKVGTGSTDFWGISFSPCTVEQGPMGEAELERGITLLQACWAFFDGVAARVSPEMRKGPRGGGRDRDHIIRHTIRAESEDFARKVGLRIPEGAALTPDGLRHHRETYVAAMRAYNAGEVDAAHAVVDAAVPHPALRLPHARPCVGDGGQGPLRRGPGLTHRSVIALLTEGGLDPLARRHPTQAVRRAEQAAPGRVVAGVPEVGVDVAAVHADRRRARKGAGLGDRRIRDVDRLHGCARRHLGDDVVQQGSSGFVPWAAVEPQELNTLHALDHLTGCHGSPTPGWLVGTTTPPTPETARDARSMWQSSPLGFPDGKVTGPLDAGAKHQATGFATDHRPRRSANANRPTISAEIPKCANTGRSARPSGRSRSLSGLVITAVRMATESPPTARSTSSRRDHIAKTARTGSQNAENITKPRLRSATGEDTAQRL